MSGADDHIQLVLRHRRTARSRFHLQVHRIQRVGVTLRYASFNILFDPATSRLAVLAKCTWRLVVRLQTECMMTLSVSFQ